MPDCNLSHGSSGCERREGGVRVAYHGQKAVWCGGSSTSLPKNPPKNGFSGLVRLKRSAAATRGEFCVVRKELQTIYKSKMPTHRSRHSPRPPRTWVCGSVQMLIQTISVSVLRQGLALDRRCFLYRAVGAGRRAAAARAGLTGGDRERKASRAEDCGCGRQDGGALRPR